MSGPKLFFILQMTVNSLPISQEILEILRRLENDAEKVENFENLEKQAKTLARKIRAPHIENQLYQYLHKMRKSHHQKTNRNLNQYLNRERHKVATVKSPHHRRLSKNEKRYRNSPRPRNTG